MSTSAHGRRFGSLLLVTCVVGCSAEDAGEKRLAESFDGGVGGAEASPDPILDGGEAVDEPSGAGGESMSPGSAGEASGGAEGLPSVPNPEPDSIEPGSTGPDSTEPGSPTPAGGAANAAGGSSAAVGGDAAMGGAAAGGASIGGADTGSGGNALGGQGGALNGGAANGGTSSAGASPGTLTQDTLAAMPAEWQEHAVVALRGEVFVLGGFNPDATDRVVAYDPDADEWRDVAPFPEVFQHANAASIDDRIYVAGYYVGSSFSNVSGETYAYDPDADEWTPREPMPQGTERSSSCVAALDGLMYVFGGAAGGAVIDASVYDPAADSWEVLAPLPDAREHCTAAGVGGRVYIAAGRSGGLSSFIESTLVFDPELGTYDELEPIPTPRGGVAGAMLGNRLVVFGGEGNDGIASGVFPDVEALDTTTGQWERLPDMLMPRHGLGAAEVGGRIYLPGGATTQGFGAAADHTTAWFE